MKKLNLLVLGIILAQMGMTQSICRTVIGSAGTTQSGTNNVSLSWTTGEAVVNRVSGGSFMLTQGFQQSDSCIVVSISIGEPQKIKLMAFPNPTPDVLHIQLEKAFEQVWSMVVVDLYGQKLSNQVLPPGETAFTIDLSFYSDGTYYLNLMGPDKEFRQTFKIVKAN